MPRTNEPGAAVTARQTRQLTKGFTAKLTGRSDRGSDRKVRRGSVDVGDRRAQVFRPIGDGTTAGALGWIDSFMKTISEWDDMQRRKGGARPLGFAGLRVLETLLGRRGTIALDFHTGRLEPAIDTIARVAQLCRTTVVRALANLKALRIIDWVRRSQKTGNDGLFGPQREQVTNAYFIPQEDLPTRVLQRLRDLVARHKLRRTNGAPAPAAAARPRPQDSELRALLDRMEAGFDRRSQEENASSPCGQYPHSGAKE